MRISLLHFSKAKREQSDYRPTRDWIVIVIFAFGFLLVGLGYYFFVFGQLDSVQDRLGATADQEAARPNEEALSRAIKWLEAREADFAFYLENQPDITDPSL